MQLSPLTQRDNLSVEMLDALQTSEITQIWTEVLKENIEQYKLKVLSRRNNTLVQRVLARIDEVPDEEQRM